ncbi:MAG: DNA-formamidopyrimidine glycosylase, partial [Bryobacteraceae bacterium]
MPELPEVEAVCRKLRREAIGATIAEAVVLRPGTVKPQEPAVFDRAVGKSVISVERRGKNILVHLSGELVLHVHLRMTGNLFVVPDARFHSARVRVYFRFRDGRGLLFEDTRALGRVNLHEESQLDGLMEDVGIEPLSRAFTPALLVAMAKATRKPAKLFLMDQSHIAGVGNMYAAEALFRARINPKQPINTVRKSKIEGLHQAIVDVLREAMKDAVRSYSKPGSYQEMDFAVYGRKGEPCNVCGRKIARIVQGGRSTYYCPRC